MARISKYRNLTRDTFVHKSAMLAYYSFTNKGRRIDFDILTPEEKEIFHNSSEEYRQYMTFVECIMRFESQPG